MVFLLNGDLRVEQVDVALALLHPTRIGGAGGKTKQIVVSVKAGHMVPNYVRDSARLTPPGHVVSTEATAYQSSGSGRALAWRGFDSLRGPHKRTARTERPPAEALASDERIPLDSARRPGTGSTLLFSGADAAHRADRSRAAVPVRQDAASTDQRPRGRR